MTTIRQADANRRNAELSTGPRTAAGKASSSQSAFVHGCFAETKIAIPRGALAEDPDEVHAFLSRIIEGLVPRDDLECQYATRIAFDCLKLRRSRRYAALALAADGVPRSADDDLLDFDYKTKEQASSDHVERAASQALLGSLQVVARIDQQAGGDLDRSLLMYARLQEREFVVDDPESETNPVRTESEG